MASRNGHTSQRLDVQGVNIPHIGYGKMVQGLRGALANHVTLDENAEHVVFALRPNLIKGWDDGRVPHCLTMWETNWLPPEFSEYLSEFKKVIVPSLHNWELFSQYHDEVHMIPLGVDRTVWRPVEREPNRKFRFMCGGSEWFRKGMDVVLEAFTSLNLPNCELHIKIVPPYLYAPKNLDYPNVVVHREWMSVEDEVNLVRSSDCFISVARGEGFGLMPLQAISAGVPTIVSDAHGHREFSDLAAARIPTVSVPTTKGEWQNMGDWDEPDMEVLCEKMVDIYENYEGYKFVAGLKADHVDAFSWDAAATQLLQIVNPSDRQVINPRWKPLEPTCEIRVKRRVQAMIGIHKVDLEPGVTHRVVLNVRDVLKDSGVLL